jgi:hypothetical protein
LNEIENELIRVEARKIYKFWKNLMRWK